MGGIIHREEFHAIKCGKDNIILGLPWLNCVNPTINWVNKHVDVHEATDQTEEYNLATSDKPFTIRKATQEPPKNHPHTLNSYHGNMRKKTPSTQMKISYTTSEEHNMSIPRKPINSK